jgi:hypothetical protein
MEPFSSDQRNHPRRPLEDELTYSPIDSQKSHSGTICNISSGGLYFQSQRFVQPNTHLCIRLNEETTRRFSDFRLYPYYRAKVKWLHNSEESHPDNLGIGVEFLAYFESPDGPDYFCDNCEDQIFTSNLHLVNDYTYLCPDCYIEYASQLKSIRRIMKRLFEGNVI